LGLCQILLSCFQEIYKNKIEEYKEYGKHEVEFRHRQTKLRHTFELHRITWCTQARHLANMVAQKLEGGGLVAHGHVHCEGGDVALGVRLCAAGAAGAAAAAAVSDAGERGDREEHKQKELLGCTTDSNRMKTYIKGHNDISAGTICSGSQDVPNDVVVPSDFA
jgi:hypothetical protein